MEWSIIVCLSLHGYVVQNKNTEPSGGYFVPTGGYSMTTGGYSVTTGGYSVPTGGYSVPTGGYSVPAFHVIWIPKVYMAKIHRKMCSPHIE